MGSDSVASLRGVKLVYHEPSRETLAVDGLDLEVKRGEFLSIVGPSGCGKTSVLSLITGLLTPSEGSVEVLGVSPAEARGRIGYMLQRDALLDWRTIERNVLLGLEVKRALTPESRSRALALLDKYGLGDFRRHYPAELSGGMRQKAALIRTLAAEPELLLLDEPFSALDYQTRILLEDEVRSIIKQGGYTAVLVTHDIAEAICMSDRVVVFSGRPARVKRSVGIDLAGTAFERRSRAGFGALFDLIWKELREE
ncbi:MAG: ABC transporter ATP-binding protein [Clostridia bacterium]|nr:ABC transporter ATP-binding protein [Clostridia bacterium]